MNIKITSPKFENEILALDADIARLKRNLDQAQKAGTGRDDAGTPSMADLQEALRQKERDKHTRGLSFSAKLAAVLDQVNGKARAWTVSPEDLIDLAHECEEEMDARGIRVKNRPGAQVHYRPAGKASRFQNGKSITTYIIMHRVHDGWRLSHAERDYCFANQTEFRETTVQSAAYEDIISHATRGFRFWEKTPPETPPESPVA